ncbi:MAG: response regulator [Dehalococcoidia bacterium]
MNGKAVILVVDSNRGNLGLLSQQLEQAGYGTLGAASLEQFDEAIRGKEKIALALVDVSEFDQNIWEHCDELSKGKLPFIVISPHRSPAIQRESMEHGASGLLIKPLDFKELMEHIHAVLGV